MNLRSHVKDESRARIYPIYRWLLTGVFLLLCVGHADAMDECGGFAVNAIDHTFFWATKVCNQRSEPGFLGWSAEETALDACKEASRNPDACRLVENGECVAGPGQSGGFATLVAWRNDRFVGCGRTEATAEKAARSKCLSKNRGEKCAVVTTLEY